MLDSLKTGNDSWKLPRDDWFCEWKRDTHSGICCAGSLSAEMLWKSLIETLTDREFIVITDTLPMYIPSSEGDLDPELVVNNESNEWLFADAARHVPGRIVAYDTQWHNLILADDTKVRYENPDFLR